MTRPRYDQNRKWRLVNDLEWTKDLSSEYFQGTELTVLWPLLKLGVLALILFLVSLAFSLSIWALAGIGIVLVGSYQHLVVLLSHGQLVYMPIMDQATFITSTKLCANIMSVIAVDGPVYNFDWVLSKHQKLMKDFPKLTYKIVQVCGDFYYKAMTQEETARRAIFNMGSEGPKTQAELDEFISANANEKLPLDGPQYRIYMQELVEEDGSKHTVMLWKSHHSWGDGVSIVALQAAFSDEFSPEYFIKTKEVPYLKQWLLSLAAFMTIPYLILKAIITKEDRNLLTRGKKNIDGKINCATSSILDMREIKNLSKKLKCTVNDVVMSSTSIALREYFQKHGEAVPKALSILMPANIRFGMYQSYDDIAIENKWAALPLTLPLIKSMDEAEAVRKQTAEIKNSINIVYASYLLTFLTTLFVPRFLPRFFLDEATRKYTLGLSNTPGPLRPYTFTDPKGQVSRTVYSQYYPLITGRVGLCISCISCYNTFKITVTADTAVCAETRWLTSKIQEKIVEAIDSQRAIAVPSSQEDSPTKQRPPPLSGMGQ